MIYPIVMYGDPVLRQRAKEIPPGTDLKQVVDDMFETLEGANGIGLAAPQIGKSIRLFIVDGTGLEDEPGMETFRKVFVNPLAGTFFRIIFPVLITDRVHVQSGSKLRDSFKFTRCLHIEQGLRQVMRPAPYNNIERFLAGVYHVDDVSQSVVSVIENELNGAKGLLYYESVSDSYGRAQITATFRPGTDPDMCGVGKSVPNAREYQGPCRWGWIKGGTVQFGG